MTTKSLAAANDSANGTIVDQQIAHAAAVLASRARSQLALALAEVAEDVAKAARWDIPPVARDLSSGAAFISALAVSYDVIAKFVDYATGGEDGGFPPIVRSVSLAQHARLAANDLEELNYRAQAFWHTSARNRVDAVVRLVTALADNLYLDLLTPSSADLE